VRNAFGKIGVSSRARLRQLISSITTGYHLHARNAILSLPLLGINTAFPPDARRTHGGCSHLPTGQPGSQASGGDAETSTNPASREDAMTVTATPGTAPRTGSRHRAVAIGLGWVELTASKALKHDLANITDALVFLTRITAQATAHVHSRTSLWPQVIPTTAIALAAVGALIALYAGTGRERNTSTRQHSETATAAGYFTSHRCLWHSQQNQKGWC